MKKSWHSILIHYSFQPPQVENRWQQTPPLPISDEAEKTSTLMVKANGIKSCSCQRNTAILGSCTRDICSENNIIHISSAL
jgi:hypothetical protein